MAVLLKITLACALCPESLQLTLNSSVNPALPYIPQVLVF